MSTRAAGLGLNLTEANYVFHFDLWWNPATALQAEDRTHRIGQGKQVFVQSLLTTGTVEERIDRILRRKGILFREVIDDLSATDIRQAISEEELLEVFDLERPPRRRETPTRGHGMEEMQLDRLSPLQFEYLVGRLYERMGYSIRPTQYTRDEGVDLYATHVSEAGTQRLAIQCKHYPKDTVGVGVARDMLGVLSTKPTITRGVVVTSGRFSHGCRRLAEQNRIELIDRPRLLGLLLKHEVPIQGTHEN